MSLLYDDEPDNRILAVTRTEKFSKLLCELEISNEVEQKQKIEEMNSMIEKMNKDDFRNLFTKERFDNIHQMIEEKKLPMENAILLLKHVGYLAVLRDMESFNFSKSLLSKRFEKMIVEEEKKKEGKNEKLLADLCECFVLLNQFCISKELLSIVLPCLLKVGLDKDESEETQKEVEMAFLALSNINEYAIIDKNMYFSEMKEIIQHHQEHNNLTRLAYHSAWEFVIKRFCLDGSLEDVISNELHFAKEAIKELEELMNCVDWKRTKEEREKESQEEKVLLRWLLTLEYFLGSCLLWNEKYSELIRCVVQVYQTAKGNNEEIGSRCIYSLSMAAKNRAMKNEDLLNGGAVNAILKENQLPTMDDVNTQISLKFLISITGRLKGKKKEKMKEEHRKGLKRKMFEKMEEEGYEDVITSFHGIFVLLEGCLYPFISLNVCDYFVNV